MSDSNDHIVTQSPGSSLKSAISNIKNNNNKNNNNGDENINKIEPETVANIKQNLLVSSTFNRRGSVDSNTSSFTTSRSIHFHRHSIASIPKKHIINDYITQIFTHKNIKRLNSTKCFLFFFFL